MAFINVAAINKAGGSVSVNSKTGNATITNKNTGKSVTITSGKDIGSKSTTSLKVSDVLAGNVSNINTNKTVNTMGAGSTYDKIDTALGGLLPGGVSPTGGAVSTALKVSGATAGVALAYGAYTAADKAFFDGKLPLGAKSTVRKKIRRYNYTNMRALKRADKRIDGFIKTSRKVISSVGYKIVRKGAN